MSPFSPGNPFVGDGLPGTPEPRVKVSNANKSLAAASQKTAEGVKRLNSQAKGKRAERALAVWWRDHGFPDAARYVKTGDLYSPDGGDLVLVHGDFRLVVEVKHLAGGLTDGQVAQFGHKLVTKQVPQSKGTMGILVERRDRVSDAGMWWVHMSPRDFAVLDLAGHMNWEFTAQTVWQPLACRTTVRYFAKRLQEAGLAAP